MSVQRSAPSLCESVTRGRDPADEKTTKPRLPSSGSRENNFASIFSNGQLHNVKLPVREVGLEQSEALSYLLVSIDGINLIFQKKRWCRPPTIRAITLSWSQGHAPWKDRGTVDLATSKYLFGTMACGVSNSNHRHRGSLVGSVPDIPTVPVASSLTAYHV